MRDKHPDLLLWVGRQYYPTIEDYVTEAEQLGCCRKVPGLPKCLDVGHTRVSLLHREATGEPGYLFGWYLVDWVVICSLQQAVVDEVRTLPSGVEIPVTAIGAKGRQLIPPRGCGLIDPPSIYLVGPDDATRQSGLRPKTGREHQGRIHLVPRASVGNLKHFRGFKEITWDALMGLLV